MNKILRLNVSGLPTAWLTHEEAATLYVKRLVHWELGSKQCVLLGGINRFNGKQSMLKISTIVATKGAVKPQNLSDSFSNRMLFRRDNFRCMYCGARGNQVCLTRDHIIPRSKGGRDTWENVVAACHRCNQHKADRTPEQAGMQLLAIPFRPNYSEAMFLAQHKVLADQMEYLEKQFSGKRTWKAA